jgi:hypothetical protein
MLGLLAILSAGCVPSVWVVNVIQRVVDVEIPAAAAFVLINLVSICAGPSGDPLGHCAIFGDGRGAADLARRRANGLRLSNTPGSGSDTADLGEDAAGRRLSSRSRTVVGD